MTGEQRSMHIIAASMRARQAKAAAPRFIRREIRRDRPVPRSAIVAFLSRGCTRTAGHRLDEGISIASGARQAGPQAALHDPHGDDDNVGKLTEAAQVKAFHQACSAKFAEIKVCIAGELGYDPAALAVAEAPTVDE